MLVLKLVRESCMSDLNLVKQLREMSGAGMMACKKALEECGNDLEKAFDFLRKSGALKAVSKSDRITKEGFCCIANNGNKVAIVKMNCETDFVAKNDKFISLLEQATQTTIEKTIKTAEELTAELKNTILEQIAVLGENITIGDVKLLEINSDESVSFYVHNKADNKDNIGKIVSLIVAKGNTNDASATLLKQINMHITAMSPVSLKEEDVSKEIIDRELAVYQEQVAQLNKPADIAKKMVDGKLRKFFEENTLLNQVFVIDNKTKIKDVLANFNKDNGTNLNILSFYRISV